MQSRPPRLAWRRNGKSRISEHGYAGTWFGPLFTICRSVHRGEGYSLTSTLPLRLPSHGVCETVAAAKQTAESALADFLRHVAPDPAPGSMAAVLSLLSPPPIEAPFTAPSQATHDNLAAELASLQVPHTTSADSAGHYVEVPLLNDFILQLHNPLGSSYGYDWAVLNEGTQVATGTWHLSPQPTAERLQALLDAVGTNSGADTD